MEPHVNKIKDDHSIYLGNKIIRSHRDAWGKTVEDLVTKHSPYPITFDVSSNQPAGFSEFSYSEYMGGIYIQTQSKELNSRLMGAASAEQTSIQLSELVLPVIDKYILEAANTDILPKKVVFLPGTNLIHLVSKEIIARLAFNDKDVFVKPHPLTEAETLKQLKRLVGAHKVLDLSLSGMELLNGCEVCYTTTASEIASVAVINNKELINISNFFEEHKGSFYPISRVLFTGETKAQRKELLANMINCNYSGLLFPSMNNIEERIISYFDKALEFRERFSNIIPTLY